MKQVTKITTTAELPGIQHRLNQLEEAFSSPVYTSDIIIMQGSFQTTIAEFLNGKWVVYNPDRNGHTEIDRKRYDYYMDVLPCIYVSAIDGVKVEKGFAVSEAYTHAVGTVVLTVCYYREGKYYECLCAMYKHSGRALVDYNAAEYSKDNFGITYYKNK